MKEDEVIEPAEIIIDQPTEEKEDFSHVNPWVRFFARMFDYAIFNFVCFILAKSYYPIHAILRIEYLLPIPFILWIPVEALLLSSWGYTPGKFLLRTKVTDKWDKKLDFKTALRRSLSVWFRGVGMGIPIINVFTMFFAFSRLKTNEITSWDKDEKAKITHYSIQPTRLVIALVIVILGFLIKKL